MYQRLMLAILVGLLVFEPTFGQESAGSQRPEPAQSDFRANMQNHNGLRLKGVLISESSRMALIGGRPVQVGDRIGGAEVLRIEQQAVRVRMGTEELSVRVGGTFVGDSSAPAFVKAPDRPAHPRQSPGSRSPAGLVTARVRSESRLDSNLRHTVQAGETLSGIALRYLVDGVTVEQMMMAVFESNREAFSDNIHVLYSGTTLHIPGGMQVASQDPAMAATAVAQHLDNWRNASKQPIVVAAATPARQYGPVESGETLSAIAESVLHVGVTLDQMMIALYHANPQAFSKNINVLHEGAVLRMPNDIELRRQAPAAATAEVARQTRSWREGVERPGLSAPLQPNIMAAAEIRLD